MHFLLGPLLYMLFSCIQAGRSNQIIGSVFTFSAKLKFPMEIMKLFPIQRCDKRVCVMLHEFVKNKLTFNLRLYIIRYGILVA